MKRPAGRPPMVPLWGTCAAGRTNLGRERLPKPENCRMPSGNKLALDPAVPPVPKFSVETVPSHGRKSFALPTQARFEAILSDTWQRLPDDVRQVLATPWRGIYRPIVLTDRTDDTIEEGICEFIGQCREAGDSR
jgi:hypothetical protein